MSSTYSAGPRTTARARRTAGWVTATGLAALACAGGIAESWRGQLPDPVAVHWGVNGPNGFSSLNALLATLLGAGALLVLGFGLVLLLLGRSSVTRRMVTAVTIWFALYLSLLTLGSLWIQRGLTDAHHAGGLGVVLGVALVGSLVPAAVAALLIAGDPPQPTSEAVAGDAPRVALTEGEQSAWTGRTDSGPVVGFGLAGVALVVALVVLTHIWALLILAGSLAVVLAAMSLFVVRIDHSGLTIRSILGWPRIRVPLDEVVRADVTDVHPVRDFGGWGLRVGRQGRVGIVLRSGEAVLVERTGGRSVVVTIDDAHTAAGLLNALADRQRR